MTKHEVHKPLRGLVKGMLSLLLVISAVLTIYGIYDSSFLCIGIGILGILVSTFMAAVMQEGIPKKKTGNP